MLWLWITPFAQDAEHGPPLVYELRHRGPMPAWAVPPPKPPTKTASQLAIERQLKVSALDAQGLLT